MRQNNRAPGKSKKRCNIIHCRIYRKTNSLIKRSDANVRIEYYVIVTRVVIYAEHISDLTLVWKGHQLGGVCMQENEKMVQGFYA